MPLKQINLSLNPDITQAEIDARIALGQFAAGTTTADIVLNSDFNALTDVADAVSPVTALGDGLVLFSSSGAVTGDSAFTWDNTNKWLGIGGTPTRDLHINAGASGTADILMERGTVDGIVQVDSSRMTVGTETNHPYRILTNNAERVTVAADGSVGIGLSITPTVKFGIQGTDGTTAFRLYNTNSAYTAIHMAPIAGPNAGAFYINQSNVTKVFLNSYGANSYINNGAGNFGINTTTPQTKFHVYGGATTIETSGSEGTLGDKLVFALTSFPTTYLNKIKTSHSGTPSLNRMTFSIATGASTSNDVLDLRYNAANISGSARVDNTADSSTNLVVAGLTKGVRIGSTTAAAYIQGVDSTGTGSHQPLFVGGSTLSFENSGTEYMKLSGGTLEAGNQTAVLGATVIKARYDAWPAQAVITEYSTGGIGFAQYMYQDLSSSWRSSYAYGAISRGVLLVSQSTLKFITTPSENCTAGDVLVTQPTEKFSVSNAGNGVFAGTLAAGITTLTSLNLTAATNQIVLDSDGTYTGTVSMASLTAARTWTFPNATGTVVLTGNSGTLQNKTMDSTNNYGNIEPVTDDTYYLGKNDDDTPKAWKGVILKDTTDGKYYRIEVISGVVTATDLTD